MGRGKRTIRASEIGTFLYCRRAWWYQRQGFRPMNQVALDAGSEFHNASAKNAQTALLVRVFAWFVLITALGYLLFSLAFR